MYFFKMILKLAQLFEGFKPKISISIDSEIVVFSFMLLTFFKQQLSVRLCLFEWTDSTFVVHMRRLILRIFRIRDD